MPSLMLVNPAKRRKVRKTRRASPKRARKSIRRTNPVSVASVKRRARRRLTVGAHRAVRRTHRRRRNPISLRSLKSGGIMKILKTAAIGGAGAIAMDAVMAQVNSFLPASLQPSATGPGLNDVVRVALAITLGRGLSKMTRGASETAAAGALTVQAANLMRPFVAQMMPSMVPTTVAGLGYMSPQRIIRGNARVSPMNRGNMGAISSGQSPLLGMYQRTGGSSLLSSARRRETAGVR